MTTAEYASEKLDIGRVFGQAFQVLGRNFVTFAVLAVIMVGLPGALVGLLQMDMLRAMSAGTLPGFSFGGVFGGLASLILSLILQGALIYGFVTDLNGRRASIADCLATGLRNFLPLLGVGVLFVLAFVAGLVLLIVPGIMIACAWCVAVPALIIDRTGVTESFSRSAALTRGSRWRIFAVGLIFVVASQILGTIVNLGTTTLMLSETGLYVLALVWAPLLGVVNALIGAAIISSLYVELRRVKEGATPDALASVFD